MKKILIVDDDAHICELLSAVLSRDNEVKCTCVENGKEALDLLQRGPFDLVVSDVMMPVMNGEQLQLSAENAGIKTRFIFMSGNMGDEISHSFRRNNFIMPKPFDIIVLRQIIYDMLGV